MRVLFRGISVALQTSEFAGKWKEYWPSMATPKRQSARPKSSSEQTPREDEVLRELYAERDAYAAENGHDLKRIYQDLKRREGKSELHRANWKRSDPRKPIFLPQARFVEGRALSRCQLPVFHVSASRWLALRFAHDSY